MNAELIDKMLYEYEDEEEVIEALDLIEDEETLYEFALHYNWDDGFLIPSKIIENKFCSLSIAMLLFYGGDGFSFFSELDAVDIDEFEEWEKEWYEFENKLYHKILDGEFQIKNTSYKIPLNKVHKYKLKKSGINDIFLNDIV